ncbi:MAG: hypothetical protein ACPG32_10445 [Akkermansiaceae bacterium]
MPRIHLSILVLPIALMLMSCASERTVTKSKVKKDAWGKDSGWSMGKDEDGNMVAKSDRRSEFEGRSSSIAGSGRDFGGKDYTKKSYRKKRWGGNTIFNKKSYEGNTDASRYKTEPWFVQQQARAQGQRSAADGKSYRTGIFGTGSAREQSANRMEHKSDAHTAYRKRVYKQPGITHWKNQQGLSVKDTNRMLGR